MSTPPHQDRRPVTASEIHAVAFCPESYRLRRAGARMDPRATLDAARGQALHDTLNREVRAAEDRRCFVASYLYGVDDPRTQSLRTWRDGRLRRYRGGRVCIAAYYRLAPLLILVAQRNRRLDAILRWIVDRLAARLMAKETPCRKC